MARGDIARLDKLIDAVIDQAPEMSYGEDAAGRLPAFAPIKDLAAEEQAACVVLTLARVKGLNAKTTEARNSPSFRETYQRSAAASSLIYVLLRRSLPWTAVQLIPLVELCITEPSYMYTVPSGFFKQIEANVEVVRSSPPLSALLSKFAAKLSKKADAESRRDLDRINAVLGLEAKLMLEPGEPWSDRALADLAAMPEDRRASWSKLLQLCSTASSANPTSKWLKSAAEFVGAIGADSITSALVSWFPLVDRPATDQRRIGHPHNPDENLILDIHMEILRGLCWIAGTIRDADLARALGRLAISAYRKIPGMGPRAVRVGNAAVYALGVMPGMDAVGQLAMLRVKVKFGTAQKMIEKALTAAAAREGLPREEIDELAVPSYGLTSVGERLEPLGDYLARLTITGIGDTELVFFKTEKADGDAVARPAGKPQKSIPAALKADHADDLKDLKAAIKDIKSMLPAQRDRIDQMFLDAKTWSVDVWRERYLDHPLVGVLARRLIWQAAADPSGPWRSFTWLDGETTADAPAKGKSKEASRSRPSRLVDAAGGGVDASSGFIRLWHPIHVDRDEVLAWRAFFETRQIRQPFKQAHREVYLLTDAERRTSTYSNRFAAHIIKQHQFNALAAIRGWKNKLRLMVDDEYPPASRSLPAHGIRAEFWIEGAGDQYGVDTNDAGTYNHLTTDQVRFYPLGAAQAHAHAGGGGYGGVWGHAELAHGIPLERIAPLVLSEILRDVDLFVGVCSVANNPQWSDGGPAGAFRNYWWSASFGDLSAGGDSRREFLAGLLPRLKIGSACSLGDKFLTVKGKLRTYKIHLGSGNILMEPNDQYLCIVPGSRDSSGGAAGDVFLPFEGDRTLSIILSKAFMLAADDQIKDTSITRQIKGS